MEEVTMIMGAGAPLDLTLPNGVTWPSTTNITEEVRKPYDMVLNPGTTTDLVERIYKQLMATFPVNHNLWWISNPQPYIHFEILFHVMEQMRAYGFAWDGNCKNPYMYPYFAPFTKGDFGFSQEELSAVMKPFIMRIMEIVNGYNEYYRNNIAAEGWFADFFKMGHKWNVFNFNYDTMVEDSLDAYEDGYEDVAGETYQKFSPLKLYRNAQDLSTVNHLHGCIRYYYKKNANTDLLDTTIHDLYKYPDYATVKGMMMGRGQSNEVSQANEEYLAGPIITGLKKTDKLSCIPYDCYHGNLYKALYSSNALVIVGYSFGDIYVNNLIRMMNMLYGDEKRIVIIDKWNQKMINSEPSGLEKYIESSISPHEVTFWQMMSGCTSLGELMNGFLQEDVTKVMVSQNHCLMILADGFKSAVGHKAQIEAFLRS
jgi:hypothetical protein